MAHHHPKPILHVWIKDEYGAVLADVDASSTVDALAYYLTSRHIEDDATPGTIALAVQMESGKAPGPRETIVRETRHPLTRAIEVQIMAEVH